MKQKFILALGFTLVTLSLKAQWVAVGAGMDFYVHASAVYNGNLYASGNFEHADGNECLGIAKWNGTAWSSVGNGLMHGAFSNTAFALVVFNNELYAGGYIDSASGVPVHKVAKWNGTTWSAVGANCPLGTVKSLCVHNGELYAGGTGPGGVAKWDGSSWSLISNTAIGATALASYNNELYAGGNYTYENGGDTLKKIGKWNGTSWNSVGGGITSNQFTSIVNALAVFDGKLYVGGGFSSAGAVTVASIATWNGSVWADVGGGVNAAVQSLLPFGNQIFVGGTYWMVNGVTANRAASWDGSSWTVLGLDLGAGARTISVYNGDLYYFGEGAFNGQNYAARWTGGTFTGIKENKSIVPINIFPNPIANQLTIDHSQVGILAIDVIDMIGRSVYSRNMEYERPGQTTIDISFLTKGIYIVRVFSLNGQKLFRVEKQ